MKIILITIFSFSIISLLVIYNIFTRIDPNQANSQIFYLLYGSLALFLTSILSILFFWVRISINKKTLITAALWPSIRQAFLLSGFILIILIMKVLGVLTLWLSLPIFLAFIFLELFFQSEKISLKNG